MVEMDPGVGAVVYSAELTRLGAIVCGAEMPRPHAELLPLSAFSRHELLSQFAEMQERASH